MSKSNSISNYFQKVSRQLEVSDKTDEHSLTVSQDSTESIALPQNQNVSERGHDICNAANFIQTPNQPSNFNFPKKLYGKQYRSVQSTWFREYPWLHYDDQKDCLFCYVCSNQYLKGNLASARISDGAFIYNGFSLTMRSSYLTRIITLLM